MLKMFSFKTSGSMYVIFLIANSAKGDRLHKESMGPGWNILERKKVGDNWVREVDWLPVCLMETVKCKDNIVDYI